jgi:ATP-dependent DNA ligase
MPYTPGERTAMVKIKPARTVDCVVGGFRYGSKSKVVGSLSLELSDEAGLLDPVGFTANIPLSDRAAFREGVLMCSHSAAYGWSAIFPVRVRETGQALAA